MGTQCPRFFKGAIMKIQQLELFDTRAKIRYQELQSEMQALTEELRPEKINCPEDVKRFCNAKLIGKKREEMIILFGNAKNSIIDAVSFAQGTIDQVVIYPREIIRKALEFDAISLIMVHNHPSGEVDPSAADIQLTSKVKNCADVFDMKLLDHIIIGNNCYFSFTEEGLL